MNCSLSFSLFCLFVLISKCSALGYQHDLKPDDNDLYETKMIHSGYSGDSEKELTDIPNSIKWTRSELYRDYFSKLQKHPVQCTPVNYFKQYVSLIDWKLFNGLMHYYTTSKRHLTAKETASHFIDIYSPKSKEKLPYYSKIWLHLGKSDYQTGPTKMKGYAPKIEKLYIQKPCLKTYYTRLFAHFFMFHQKQYSPNDKAIPLRFLIFVHGINEVNAFYGQSDAPTVESVFSNPIGDDLEEVSSDNQIATYCDFQKI